MIQVITTVDVRANCMEEFLAVLGENIPRVQAEEGCLAYEAMVDVESGIPTQGEVRENTVTLVEAWVSMAALKSHLRAAHMTSFRETAAEYVQDVRHQILQPR